MNGLCGVLGIDYFFSLARRACKDVFQVLSFAILFVPLIYA
jgi:hypothetical protein